ncbi:MAG TPA: hypothetical protein V6C69_08355 [Trichormus sp.]|jgi:hypothetical protein
MVFTSMVKTEQLLASDNVSIQPPTEGDNFHHERLLTADVLRMHEQIAANARKIQDIIAGAQFALNDSGVAHLVLAGFAPDQKTDSSNYPLHVQLFEKNAVT